jgi:hypothetical protein
MGTQNADKATRPLCLYLGCDWRLGRSAMITGVHRRQSIVDLGMQIVGATHLKGELKAEPLRKHKAVLNETGILIFPASTQHATIKADGISYEDDYKGNALAAVFDAHKFEIRGHREFSDERVRLLLKKLSESPELSFLNSQSVTYQGKTI